MFDNENVILLLDKVPDYKIGYVLDYVQGITITIEEFAKQEGLTL